MIQERMQTRNIDSKRRSGGFDCCALAMQRRVLQHIHSNNGQTPVRFDCPLSAKCGHPDVLFDNLVGAYEQQPPDVA